MFVSLAVHGVVLGAFAVTPPTPFAPAPEYLAVELVAASPPGGAARPTPRPAAKAPAPAPPEPAPEPAPPPPAPAPPVTKAPVQVLPEEDPGRIREAKPEPETVAKVVAKPEPRPADKPTPKPPPVPTSRPRPVKEKELSFEDAMAALEDELGGDATRDLLKPQGSGGEDAKAEATSVARPGVTVSPEQLAWDREVSRMIRERFPSFAQYQGRGLAARIEVVVSADGKLAGEPRLLRTSGDLDFDRLAITVVLRAAPLPPPPTPGARQLSLMSEER